jgi:3-oxoacyl-[acyl-carrier protein] reductase
MKNVLIVGASKGIGLQTATLLKGSYNVITASKTLTPELDNLQTTYHALDAANLKADDLNNLPEQIHGVVFCPGSINLKPFNRLSSNDFLNDFNQNLIGAVQVIQKVLPNLKKAEGASIVLFSTVAAKLGMPFHASIAASKGAIEGLAKSLAAELANVNIRVNVIAPSLTDTPLAQMLLNSPEKKEAAGKRHPIARVGNTNDMAQLAAFLLSNNSSWITGQIIGVDGGLGSLKV